ncbi:N-acetylglucosamine-6-phosphate deacetylase [Cohnella nanjingensis]|uniref:Amidohydrolase family protein n=1 Tax=Cohnella nanjingensis TaxID=1387779 RepID=A0A7X0RPS6_9BACL|nr:amidohydrolase family protein [Cohnella nanjingensis]MBB6671218.1 amidohydrolase family protein [Cohnella nanjingensis]
MSERGVVRGLHYRTSAPTAFGIEDGRFADVRAERSDVLSVRDGAASDACGAKSAPGGEASPLIVAPGLVDLQINGYKGLDFNGGPFSPALVHQVTRELWAQGVTSYCPTLITNGQEQIGQALRTLAAACDADVLTGLSIPGIHLEGPFISPLDGPRGAHDAKYVRAPDLELVKGWQEAASGRIRLLTLSPEWPGAGALIRGCEGEGIRVSIGHTAASPEQIREAIEAGAVMSTHLGNGMHLNVPRHPNYMWEQLAADALWACYIGDGHHLPDAVIRVIRRVKGKRALLVSDAAHLCGMPPGRYHAHIGGDVVLTPEGRLHPSDAPGMLAGSAQLQLAALNGMIRRGLCDFAEGWDSASIHPAEALGLPAGKGLLPEAPADFVLLERDERSGELRVRETFKAGASVYGSE